MFIWEFLKAVENIVFCINSEIEMINSVALEDGRIEYLDQQFLLQIFDKVRYRVEREEFRKKYGVWTVSTMKSHGGAKRVDLVKVAESLGYTLKRVGHFYTLKAMDSIHFYNHSNWFR